MGERGATGAPGLGITGFFPQSACPRGVGGKHSPRTTGLRSKSVAIPSVRQASCLREELASAEEESEEWSGVVLKGPTIQASEEIPIQRVAGRPKFAGV